MARNENPRSGRGQGAAVCSDDGNDTTPVSELADRLAFGVPNELRPLKGWLLWKRGQAKPGGKFDKVPYYASGRKRFGTQGGSEDRAKLATFDVALARLRLGGYDGLGLAMLGQGVVGLDFDGCCDGAGIIAPWVLDLCRDTYAEISPSGTGVRVFYRGDFPDRKNHAAHVEVFCHAGFLTVTGARLNGCDLSAMPEAVASELGRRLGPDKARSDSAEVLSKACAQDPTLARLNELGLVLRDMGGGKFHITCPFVSEHTTPGGAGDTVYFAAHTGGYTSGNFDCKHSHCSERAQSEFRAALGRGVTATEEPPIESYEEVLEAQRERAAGNEPKPDTGAAAGGDSQDKDGPREARDGQAPGSAKASSEGQTGPETGAAPWDAEVIETAIANLSTDIGAIFELAVITALKSVRESKPADYQRYRKRIKDAGASVAELDRLVCVPEKEGDDAQGAAVLFPDIEPCPEPVDGAKLLTDLAATFERYAILPDHADVALALWVIFTHCIDAVSVAPILALTSPEKRCGKSTVLALLRRLVLRPLTAANITAASLFRSIEAWKPTLLIDEADTFIGRSDELRGVLNSGHTRDSAFVVRTVGENHEPRKFSTWGAKAIALIGKLKDTLADRSVEISLKRKLPGERVGRLRHADPELFQTMAQRCARWATDHAKAIRTARPETPEELHDRAADNWEPLLAIADLVGSVWSERARAAALTLSGGEDAEGDSVRVQLLADIRDVFEHRGADRISSDDLTNELITLEDRPWAEHSRGNPLTKARLSRLLRPFRVVSKSIRLPDGRTPKGYLVDQFNDAFSRYLPSKRHTATT